MTETMLVAAAPGLTEEIVARVFLCIALVIVVARVAGWLARKVRQPAVVGEIVAGILLGPSLLGLVDEGLPTTLFPLDTRPFLGIIAQLGLIIFMFIVGLELDMSLIRGKERIAAATSVTSVALPFALGIAGATVLWQEYGVVDGEEVEWLHFALFLGAAMSVTAFPVLARILTERRMHRTRLGVLTLAAAAVDDVIAWSLLAAVLAIVGAGAQPQVVVLLTVLYVAGMILVVRPLLVRLVDRYQAVGHLTPDVMAIILAGVLVSSYLTSEIGIHAIFGAFFFGAILPREGAHQMIHELLDRVEMVTVILLLPVFFVVTGLQVDVTGLGVQGLEYLALVLVIACTGKFVGAFVGAKTQRVDNRQALALGALMNTRGLTELVILTIGLEIGVLNTEMFTIMVVMAVFTTIITEPLLRVIYPEELVDREIAEAERIGSAEAEAFRVLVGTPEDGPGTVLATLAAELTHGEEPREVALVQFSGRERDLELGGGIDALAASLEGLHQIETAVEATGTPVYARSRTSDDPGRLLGLLADESVADVVLVPADAGFAPPGGTQAAAAPVARLELPEAMTTAGPVTVALSESNTDRAALDLGLRLAVARGTTLTVTGSPNRRLGGPLDRLAEAGLLLRSPGAEAPTAGLTVQAGSPGRTPVTTPTLWVNLGRDDGVDRLRDLIDRLTASTPTEG